MKKLRLLMMLAVTLVITLMMAGSAYADPVWVDPNPDAEYPVLALDDPLEAEFENESSLLTYKITPSESADYILSSSGDSDVTARLLTYSDGEFVSLDDDDDSGLDYNFVIAFHLEKDKTYYLQLATYDGTMFTLSMEKNNIESISYVPYKPFTVKEHTNGSYHYSDDNKKTFIYSLPSFEANDVLIVKETGKDPVTYTCKEYYDDEEEYYYYRFVDADNHRLPYGLSFSSEQYDTPWVVGNNKYYAEYMGCTAGITAVVEKYDVQSISLEPAEPYSLLEEELGEFVSDDSVKWFKYEFPSFNYGDILSITDADGTTVDYKYDDEDEEYGVFYKLSEEGETDYNNYIDASVLLLSSDQETTHWTVEGPNSFTVSFEGKSCDVPVIITENDVESISFEKADGTTSYSINEADSENGYWDYDNFYYEVSFQVGDKLTVNYKSGDSKAYTWTEEVDEEGDNYGFFVDAENNRINGYDIYFYYVPDQREEMWEPGKTYGVNVRYKGRTLENPIPVTVIAGSLEDVISEANALLETYNDLNSASYTEDSWDEFSERKAALLNELENEDHTYISIRRSIDYLKNAYDRLKMDNHSFWPVDPETAKTIGDGFTEDVTLNPDYRTVTYKFECEEDGRYIFKSMPVGEEDETDTYGRMLVYNEETGKYSEFVDDDDSSDGRHFLLTFDGEAGKTYWLQARLYNTSNTGTFTVSFSKDPVKSIEYVCASEKQYEQYLDGNYDEDSGLFRITFQYDEGDEIVITYNDGQVKKYVYQLVEDGYYAFVNKDDTTDFIDPDRIYISSDQYVYDEDLEEYVYNEWAPGEHSFTLRYIIYEVTVPVTVVPSSITGIDFIHDGEYERTQNDTDYGYLEDETEGVAPYFYYYMPGFVEGDKLILYRGEETEEYVCDEYGEYFYCADSEKYINTVDIRRLSDQSDKHWMPNKENYFTIKYAGRTVDVPVTIISDGSEESARAAAVADAQTLLDSDDIKDVSEADYTADTYKEFAKAKKDLEDAIKDDSGKTSEEIKTLTTALETAKDNLKTKAAQEAEDRAAAVIAANVEIMKAKAIKADEYTEGSYKAVTDAQAALEAAIANKDSKAADITAATTDLTKAMSNLKTKAQAEKEAAAADADKAIKAAAALKADDYTEGTYKAVTDAKTALEAVLAKTDATAADIKAATKTLNDAIGNLKTKAEEAAEKEAAARATAVTDAQTFLDSDDIKNVKEADYTEDTYKAFAEAKKALEDAVKDDSGKTSEEIKALTTALNTAKANLKTKEQEAAEKEAAAKEEAVKAANTELDKAKAVDGAVYTDSTYKAVTDAQAALEAALKDEKATSEDIKKATKALTDALAGLKTKEQEAAEQEAAAKAAAKTAADKAVADAAALNAADYTEESYKAVADAKAALEAVLAKADAKAADITAATKTLTDAIAALEKIPAVADGDVVTVSGSSYVVTSTAKLTAALKKAKNVKSMTIPATVKLADGKSYKVTQVNEKSLTGNKIRAVTVGKNVKKLAKNAFKSSKATKIILETKLLKKSGVKGSLKGSKVKKVYVKVGSKKVNKKTVKAYKKIFTKKIAGKKVKVK